MRILEIITAGRNSIRRAYQMLDLHRVLREDPDLNTQVQQFHPAVGASMADYVPPTAAAKPLTGGGVVVPHEAAISSDFLANIEGFNVHVSSWQGGAATRYWKGGTEFDPMMSVIIGTSPANFNKWQIWQKPNGVIASGAGQASFSNAYAKFISTWQNSPQQLPNQTAQPTTQNTQPELSGQSNPTGQATEEFFAGSPHANEILADLNQHAISVGGDPWNKSLAVRLEAEYTRSRPNMENLVNESLGSTVDYGNEDDDEDSDIDWGSLSTSQQEEAESGWKSSHFDSYYNSEVEYWFENSADDDAEQQVVEEFETGESEWAQETIENFLAENADPDTQIPYTADQLVAALLIDNGTDGVAFEFNLPQQPPSQMLQRWRGLPGIPEPDTMPKWQQALSAALTEAFESQVSHAKDNLNPPDYLSDSAQESLDDSWASMNDDQKFEYAKDHLDHLDIEEQISKTSFDRLPDKFDPLNLTTGQDYQRTQAFARVISARRAAQLLIERGLAQPETALAAVQYADANLWNAWKESSTTQQGLVLQVATADELGGRLRLKQDQKEQSVDYANAMFSKIGGYQGIRAIVRAKWETTQYMLDQAGHHVLNLYRSVALDADALANERKETVAYHTQIPDVQVQRNGAASTTVSSEIANGWGSSANRVVLRLEIPRTAALSVPAYGQNVHSEQEVVVAGTAWSRWDAWLDKAPTFENLAIGQAGSPPAKYTESTLLKGISLWP